MTLVNGSAAQVVEIGDRGLAYGDGLFETIAVVRAAPQHWERHMSRLRHGAVRLGMEAPADAAWLADWQILSRNCPSDAVLKIQLTRGGGGRGYAPPDNAVPTRITQLLPRPAFPPGAAEHGVALHVCATRLGRNPLLAGIKHLNRLEQVLASAELAHVDAADGLMLDTEGHVVETTRANLFLVLDGHLLTPPIDNCGIAGVMRDVIIEVCRTEGIEILEQPITLAMVKRSSEMFMSNSLIGIWPVRQVDGVLPALPVGARTRFLQDRLGQLALLP